MASQQTVKYSATTGKLLQRGETTTDSLGNRYTQGQVLGGGSSTTAPVKKTGGSGSVQARIAAVAAPVKKASLVNTSNNGTAKSVGVLAPIVQAAPKQVAVPQKSTGFFNSLYNAGSNYLHNVEGGAGIVANAVKGSLSKLGKTQTANAMDFSGATGQGFAATPTAQPQYTAPGQNATFTQAGLADKGMTPTSPGVVNTAAPAYNPASNMSINPAAVGDNMSTGPMSVADSLKISEATGGSPGAHLGQTTQQASESLNNASLNGASNQASVMASYPGINSNINNSLLNLNTSRQNAINNPFNADSYNKNQDLETVKNSTASSVAGNFTDMNSLNAWEAANPDLANKVYGQGNPAGLTKADIVAKIKPQATNGIVGPQSTDQYLSQTPANGGINAPATLTSPYGTLNGETNNDNAYLKNQYNFNKQQQDALLGNETIIGQAQTDKNNAQAAIDATDRALVREKAKVSDKAQYEINKLTSQMDAQDAQNEIDRQANMTQMTANLAALGALTTTGAAIAGASALNAKYDAARTVLRSQYNQSVSSINLQMSGDMYDLDTKRDSAIVKINDDLSKSEAQIQKEVFKIQNDYNKDVYKTTQDHLKDVRTQTDKYSSDSKTALNAYNAQWLSLVGMGIDPTAIPSMLGSNGKIKMTTDNANTIQAAKSSKTDGTPAYKGQTVTYSPGNTKSLNDLGVSSDQMIAVQNALNSGWSLEQVAKKTNMPTNVFNQFTTLLNTQ